MLRSSHVAASLLALVSSVLATAGGCHVIAGIDEKTLNGGGGSDAGSGGEGGGAGGLLCGSGAPSNPACTTDCDGNTSKGANACHCGECYNDCGGADCKNSLCSAVSMADVGQRFVYGVATNGKGVFFPSIQESSPSTTYINRVEFDSTAQMSPHVLGTVEGTVYALAADCEYVYFAVNPSNAKGTIKYISQNAKNGTPTLLEADLVAENVEAMAADLKSVYWASNGGMNPGIKTWSMGKGVETVTTEIGGGVTGLVVRGGYLYWAVKGDSAVSGSILRAAIPAEGTEWNPEFVVVAAGKPQGLAVDDQEWVYWIDMNISGALPNLKKGRQGESSPVGLGTVTVSQGPNFPATWLAVDNQYVYFVEEPGSGSAKVGRMKKTFAMNSKQIIVDSNNVMGDLPNAYSLAIDAERLYFSSPSSGGSNRILWVAK